MLPIHRFAVITLTICSCVSGYAQDDAGVDIPRIRDARPTAEQEAGPDPFADQLMSLAGRGNRQMAEAISSLARTDRWPLVNQLLEKLATQNLDAASLAAMQKEIEPAVFLEMRLNDQLSEKAKSILDRVAAATKQDQQSPQRLRVAIDNLDAPSTDDRLAASRVLVEGGNPAIVALVAAAVKSQPPADRDAILRAMLRLGDGGNAALRQLALYGNAQARTGAVAALARIDARGNAVDLLTALHSPDSSAEEIATTKRTLQKISGNTPSRLVAVNTLLADLRQKQRAANELDNTDEVLTHWSVNDQRDGVMYTKTFAIFSAYRDAADAAARLRRIGGLASEVVPEALVADMGYRALIDPDWGDPSQVESIVAAYGSALDATAINQALARANELRDHAAAVGLIRLIDSIGQSKSGDAFLFGNGAAITPLVASASSSDPRVRYEAALTAARMADGAAFPGSSQVKRSLSEMTRLADLPTAVIVETRPEVIAPIQRIISQLGYSGEVVHNVAQLRQCIDRGGDVRLIISKTQLADLSPIELVDVIRRSSRGNELPIVFFSDDVTAPEGLDPDQQGIDAMRWDGPTVWIDQPRTSAAFTGILERIDLGRRLPPLSPIDRQQFRREANALISSDGSE
jgi:CheY-like chemotaxis protein